MFKVEGVQYAVREKRVSETKNFLEKNLFRVRRDSFQLVSVFDSCATKPLPLKLFRKEARVGIGLRVKAHYWL